MKLNKIDFIKIHCFTLFRCEQARGLIRTKAVDNDVQS